MTGTVDKDLAEKMSEHFFECILAPGFSEEALSVLTKKKNLRLISFSPDKSDDFKYQVRTISGGLLLQSKDQVNLDIHQTKVATKRPPSEAEWNGLAFAWKLVKHVHSNAIIYTTDRQG